ncbi:MAG TPA: DUF805 domain-containing protein [Acidimicrobiia bacterium]|jgi:uncharacterized membrane protein YhaH (DUF805 family)|nr:DUF805 domain-containing protein [Acidimicrobiia bacterium]
MAARTLIAESPASIYGTVVFERYAQFEGRARRAEFWWFHVVHLAVAFMIALIGELDGIERLSQALLVLYFLGTIVPVVAVAVRRLHDTGRSGRTLLLALIPVIGPIILLVLYLSDGDAEMNDYGASPKYRWS